MGLRGCAACYQMEKPRRCLVPGKQFSKQSASFDSSVRRESQTRPTTGTSSAAPAEAGSRMVTLMEPRIGVGLEDKAIT
jgi:hypothetical protein